MDRFYITESDEALDAANFLVQIGFEEAQSAIVDDNDDTPRILIDLFTNSFFFLDDAALVIAKDVIANLLNEKVVLVDYKTIKSWTN
jgi:hypothetical protein